MEKIGPSILMIHSQSGAFAWPVADQRPDLVKMIVAVEPNGPPVREVLMVGAPDWFQDGKTVKRSGLGEVPLNYDPPLAADAHARLRAAGEGRRPRHGALLAAEGAGAQAQEPRQHPGLGDHVRRRPITRPTITAPSPICGRRACRTDFIRLADLGIRGNGHMMMLEKNSDDIARVMDQWIGRQIGNERGGRKGRKR